MTTNYVGYTEFTNYLRYNFCDLATANFHPQNLIGKVWLMSIEEQDSCEWTLVKNNWKFQPDQ